MVEIFYADKGKTEVPEFRIHQTEEEFWFCFKIKNLLRYKYFNVWGNVGGTRVFTKEETQFLINEINDLLQKVEEVTNKLPPPESIGTYDLGQGYFEKVKKYGKPEFIRFLKELRKMAQESLDSDKLLFFSGD